MVAQLFKEVEQRRFTEEEKSVIEWALEVLWKDQDHSHQKDGFSSQTRPGRILTPRAYLGNIRGALAVTLS